MKNILTTLFCLMLTASVMSQAPTSLIMEDVSTNGTDFTLGITFDADAPGPVTLDNSSITFFVDGGFTGANLIDAQGGAWAVQSIIDNATLILACGAGPAQSYAMIQISTGGQANLGAVTTGVKEDLVTVSLTGPGNIAIPVKPFDVTLADPLSACVEPAGADNVASIDPDGNAGTDPSTGYQDIPGGAAFSLPIELLSFTAKKTDDNSVGLRWTTSSEVNSSHFDIEKSKDGFFFEKIGEVRASGNSNVPLDYNFTDKVNIYTQTSFTYYYRLKMVDLDGASEYSDVRSASFGGLVTPTLSVFPNPATTRLSISTGSNEGEIQIHMSDIDGRLVYKNTIPENSDLFDIYVDETSLIPGTYFMEFIQNDEVISTEKVILMK